MKRNFYKLADDPCSNVAAAMGSLVLDEAKDNVIWCGKYRDHLTPALNESVQTQVKWITSEQQLRDRILAAVIQMVISAHRSYLVQFEPLLENCTRNSEEYIKYSPEMLETILGFLFSGCR